MAATAVGYLVFLLVFAAFWMDARHASARSNTVIVAVKGIEEGTGLVGTAMLTKVSDGVDVTVKFPVRTAVNGPAAIYQGSCAASGTGRLVYHLRPLSNGESETHLRGASLRRLTSRGYVVVLNLNPPLCGDLHEAQSP
jgi:hypothetical protein